MAAKKRTRTTGAQPPATPGDARLVATSTAAEEPVPETSGDTVIVCLNRAQGTDLLPGSSRS